MIPDGTYYSVSALCAKHQLTQKNFADIFLSENMNCCIYLSNLKTYFFDFVLINQKVDYYEVQSQIISGLFYLTPYETRKILHHGEAFVSHIRPMGKEFITLAHPHRITFSDLLVAKAHLQTVDKICNRYAHQQIDYATRTI